jgi:hypothetical protein
MERLRPCMYKTEITTHVKHIIHTQKTHIHRIEKTVKNLIPVTETDKKNL